MYCRSSHLTNELNLQIKNPSTNICLDAQGKIETDESPVGVYECHGQGGNQVSISTSKLPSQLNSPSNTIDSMSSPPLAVAVGSLFFKSDLRLYICYIVIWFICLAPHQIFQIGFGFFFRIFPVRCPLLRALLTNIALVVKIACSLINPTERLNPTTLSSFLLYIYCILITDKPI